MGGAFPGPAPAASARLARGGGRRGTAARGRWEPWPVRRRVAHGDRHRRMGDRPGVGPAPRAAPSRAAPAGGGGGPTQGAAGVRGVLGARRSGQRTARELRPGPHRTRGGGLAHPAGERHRVPAGRPRLRRRARRHRRARRLHRGRPRAAPHCGPARSATRSPSRPASPATRRTRSTRPSWCRVPAGRSKRPAPSATTTTTSPSPTAISPGRARRSRGVLRGDATSLELHRGRQLFGVGKPLLAEDTEPPDRTRRARSARWRSSTSRAISARIAGSAASSADEDASSPRLAAHAGATSGSRTRRAAMYGSPVAEHARLADQAAGP